MAALGSVIRPALEDQFGGVTIVQSRDELAEVLPQRLRFDVAVVDLMWNSFDLEWSFDGLDVVKALRESRREAPVLLALQGNSFELDHLHEASRDPLVLGGLLKGEGLQTLSAGIEAVAEGRRFWSKSLPTKVRSPDYSVHRFFSRRLLAAHVAGAIASRRAHSWVEMQDVIPHFRGSSQSSVEKLTAAFGEALWKLGEVSDPQDVKQAVIFRWCGEHARYIIGWCRRHGLKGYDRNPNAVPARPSDG